MKKSIGIVLQINKISYLRTRAVHFVLTFLVKSLLLFFVDYFIPDAAAAAAAEFHGGAAESAAAVALAAEGRRLSLPNAGGGGGEGKKGGCVNLFSLRICSFYVKNSEKIENIKLL